MSLPYSKKVVDLFANPKNVGEIENADASATEGSPSCGDMIKLSLKVNPETKVIDDIKFKSYGCASNIATASVITEIAKGKTIDDAKNITWEEAEKELGGLPLVKKHCAVLAVDALKTAISNYENIHGLGEKIPTTVDALKKKLSRVINPASGSDLISDKLASSIEFNDGKVSISLNQEENWQFAETVKEDVIERLSPLWDVSAVEVKFLK